MGLFLWVVDFFFFSVVNVLCVIDSVYRKAVEPEEHCCFTFLENKSFFC